MSKSDGTKIVIQFDDDLIGDVGGGKYKENIYIVDSITKYTAPPGEYVSNTTKRTQGLRITLIKDVIFTDFVVYVPTVGETIKCHLWGNNGDLLYTNTYTSSIVGWNIFKAVDIQLLSGATYTVSLNTPYGGGGYYHYTPNGESSITTKLLSEYISSVNPYRVDKHDAFPTGAVAVNYWVTLISFMFVITESRYVGDEGSEKAFRIIGQEYNYVPGGDLIESEYTPFLVERKKDTTDTIVIEMDDFSKFGSSVGDLRVVYSGGYLMGEGGPVEPFEEAFTPTDLIMKPHQKVRERLQVNDINVIGSVIPVNFIELIHREKVIINNINVIAQITNIDDI